MMVFSAPYISKVKRDMHALKPYLCSDLLKTNAQPQAYQHYPIFAPQANNSSAHVRCCQHKLARKGTSSDCLPAVVDSFLCVVCLENTAVWRERGNRQIILHKHQDLSCTSRHSKVQTLGLTPVPMPDMA